MESKMIERITYEDEWLDNLIQKAKYAMKELTQQTFQRYREIGQDILNSGYQKGRWKDKHKRKFLLKLKISRRTFSYMVKLGKMTEQEFGNVVSQFSSFHQWANQPKDKKEIDFPELPKGKFRTIVVDPPWNIKKILRTERPSQNEELDYKTLTLKQIENDVGELVKEKADKNCHVYLWTTHKFLPKAFQIFKAWGVKYECLLTWVKNVGFTPFSWMYSTEHILFGRIGNLPLLKKGERLDFKAKVREHSRKPDEFYELIRKVSPPPRIDFFSREKREGFEPWGNEVNKFNAI